MKRTSRKARGRSSTKQNTKQTTINSQQTQQSGGNNTNVVPTQGVPQSSFAEYQVPVPYPSDFKPQSQEIDFSNEEVQFSLMCQRRMRMIDPGFIQYIENEEHQLPESIHLNQSYFSYEMIHKKVHPVAPYTQTDTLFVDLEDLPTEHKDEENEEIHTLNAVVGNGKQNHINEDDHSEYAMAMHRDDDEGMGDDEQLGGISTEFDDHHMTM